MKYPRGSRCFAFSVLLISLSVVASAQQKPRPKPGRFGQAAAPAPALEGDPVLTHYGSAETFQLAGDLNSAESEYRRVISLALQRMAAVRILAEDSPHAITFLKSAIVIDPSDVAAQVELASVDFRDGDLRNASSILKSVVAKDEQQSGARNLFGKVLFMQGDYTGAAEQLKAAWADNPDVDVAYSLALTYLKLNQVSNAGNLFDEMLSSLGSSAEVHVLIGRAYLEGGQYDLAVQELQKALALNPRVLRAHAYLGKVYLLQGGDKKTDDAKNEFEAELLNNPGDYSSHFQLGVSYLQEHDVNSAQQELENTIRIQPNSPEAHFQLGRAEMEAGNTEAALLQFEKAIQLYGADPQAGQPVLEAYATALEKSGNHDLAQRELKLAELRSDANGGDIGAVARRNSDNEVRALMSTPVSGAGVKRISDKDLAGLKDALGNAYHNLGVILARRGEYSDATSLFVEAAGWSPEIKTLDKNWGTASFRAQRYKEAIAPLERYTRASPQDLNGRQMLGLSYFMSADYVKSAVAFRPLLSKLPNNPTLLYAAGVSLAKTGDSKGASEVFRTMLAQNPNAAEVHLFLGQAYADMKQDGEALKEFSHALELNSKLPEANYGAGMIHLRQGNRDQAEADFRAELSANPGDPSAEHRLGYILLGEQKQAEAVEMLQDVVKKQPNDADAQFTLGKALLEKGDIKPAVERLEAAIRLAPDQPHPYYQLSLAYRRDGRTKDAEAILQQYERLKQKKIPVSSESQSAKAQ